MLTLTLFAALLLQSVNWTTYSGDYNGQRHSPLTEVTPANVSQLRPVWTFQTGVLGKWEASPLVIDGVIYTSGQDNNAWAIEAKTGRMLWRYRRDLQTSGLSVCCGAVNRGLAIYK